MASGVSHFYWLLFLSCFDPPLLLITEGIHLICTNRREFNMIFIMYLQNERTINMELARKGIQKERKDIWNQCQVFAKVLFVSFAFLCAISPLVGRDYHGNLRLETCIIESTKYTYRVARALRAMTAPSASLLKYMAKCWTVHMVRSNHAERLRQVSEPNKGFSHLVNSIQ